MFFVPPLPLKIATDKEEKKKIYGAGRFKQGKYHNTIIIKNA